MKVRGRGTGSVLVRLWAVVVVLTSVWMGPARADDPPPGTKLVFTRPIFEEGRDTKRYHVTALEYNDDDQATRLRPLYDFLYRERFQPFFISDPGRDREGRLPWLVVGVTYSLQEGREGNVNLLGKRGWRYIPLRHFGPQSERIKVEKLEFFKWNKRQILVERTSRRWDRQELSRHLFLWDVHESRWEEENERKIVWDIFPYSRFLKENGLHDLDWVERISEDKFALIADGKLALVKFGTVEDDVDGGRSRAPKIEGLWNLRKYKKNVGDSEKLRMVKFEAAEANSAGVWIQAVMHDEDADADNNPRELIWIPFDQPETDGVALTIQQHKIRFLGIRGEKHELVYAQESKPYHFMSANSEDAEPEIQVPSFFNFGKLFPLAELVDIKTSPETRVEIFSRQILD